MRQKVISIFLCYLLLYTCGGVEAHTRKDSDDSNSGFWDALTYVAVGGGLLAMGLPALGFTATGIAANSWAASMMSWSAVANGGGVPAGGLVATLQSLGDYWWQYPHGQGWWVSRLCSLPASKEQEVEGRRVVRSSQVTHPCHPSPYYMPGFSVTLVGEWGEQENKLSKTLFL
ncbi:interferon alpha-inducible protein 6 isoform X1 [Phyllostomus discolor]|uniref:Interferon alpha-inducible protein 6 isoform X1 n=1 Tax=Phyllostomus discolor TaxID=89673 RepID=A0A7E6DRT0_9CHIR|nr:interferon alpha-inducible protein 6 isoform X1 [Phyllostomus discolor]